MTKRILGIGATLIDELYFCTTAVVPNSSNPAQKTTRIGGVIHNIIYHLALLGVRPALITALGNDAEAQTIKNHLAKNQIDSGAALIADESTGKYVSVLDQSGALFVAVCEDNCGRHLTITYLESQSKYMKSYDVLIIDTNLETEVIQWLIHFAREQQKLLIIEPVSVTKASKLSTLDLRGVYLITPNEEELLAINCNTTATQNEHIKTLFERGVENLWIRQGAKGSTWLTAATSFSLEVPQIGIVDTTGAGDAALAGWLYGFVNQKKDTQCIQLGHSLAMCILQQKGAVDPTITAETLINLVKKFYYDY